MVREARGLRPPAGPYNLAWFDSPLGALNDTGLSEKGKVGVVMGR
ncbi:MAG TPA: hypothetical protein VGD71_42365 [Kribbella sp.]